MYHKYLKAPKLQVSVWLPREMKDELKKVDVQKILDDALPKLLETKPYKPRIRMSNGVSTKFNIDKDTYYAYEDLAENWGIPMSTLVKVALLQSG